MKKETFREDISQVIHNMEQVVYGKSEIVQLLLVAIICNDHVLLEDVPGTGKTMLITTLAKSLDLSFKRIQGTPDLLPSDLTGTNVYNQADHKFSFLAGPVFTNILLFDEINRASPKTQSALLEAMAEDQVSIDNETYELPEPFFVMATQNPVDHVGTYTLPQAQLDRFLIKTELGYPTRADEKKILLTRTGNSTQELPYKKLSREQVLIWQEEYQNIEIKDDVLEKIQNIIDITRTSSVFKLGISPRSGQKFIRALKANAYIHNRTFVTKDDIYDLFLPVMQHRVFLQNDGAEKETLLGFLNEAGF